MSVQQMGRYQTISKLGEGAMGIVYRAFDPLLERVVAIKTIKLELTPAEQEEFEQRFFKEAKSAARLNHPCIVTVFDAGKVEDTAYIAMEFMEGCDLRQMIIKDQAIPHDRVAEIAAAVADGLGYAHRNGVVHRDIKPANIMVLNNGTVKIADFGIAQLQSGAKTMTGHVMGTPKYMSPEQIMGKQVDGRSDIFSLGIMLYQMLTTVSPFDSASVTSVMYKVIHEPALIPSLLTPDVPPGFEFILARALAKAPEKRYQTAEEMAVDLRRYKELAENDNASWDGTALTRQEPEAERVIDITNADDGTVIREDGSAGQERTIKLARAPAAASTPLETTPAVTSGQPKKRPVVPVAIGLVLLVIAGAVTMLGGKPTGPVQNSAPSEAVSPPLPPSAPAGKATLTFAITPWGEIFIDGVSYGASPPLSDIEVVAGKHHIEIRNTGHKSRVQELEIKHGDAQKIKHKF